ncbi:MAG: hypothetical protein ABSB66_12790 [Candidatus Acidiferrales bacterium]|jgi:hypothetical protein
MILKPNSSLSRRAIFLISAAIVPAMLLVATAPSHANRRPHPVSAAAGPDTAFVADKGKFRIMVNGQQVGKEEFEIGPSGSDWVAHGTSEIQAPKGSSHVTGTLNLRPDGTPTRYEWSTDSPKKASSTVVFNGVVANVELRVEGARPYTQQFTFNSPRIVVLDNNLYHQYAILFRLYDWDKKGAQSFSVLVPQEITPGSITVESLGKQDIGGASLEELRVKTEDNEIDAFFDGAKLMRLLAPSANAEIIRE